MANEKFVKQVGGVFSETSSVSQSAGAGDAGKVVALNTSGKIDDTVTSRPLSNTSSADAMPILDANGKLDLGMFNLGAGDVSAEVYCQGGFAAGDLVNIYYTGGNFIARKADASAGVPAHGFVKSAYGDAATATVYFEGILTLPVNSVAAGATSTAYLGSTGLTTMTPPSTAGHISQVIGTAVNYTSAGITIYAAEINFKPQPPVTLA